MSDIGAWLSGLGLERYAAAFRDNEVDAAALPRLTAEDLKGLGVTVLGHRHRLLDAIATLRKSPERAPAPADQRAVPVSPPGGPGSPAEHAGTAERRQVSLLVCDLVGSTALAARLDPEDLREVLAAYQRRAAEVVGRWSGRVANYVGDGVLACFGHPEAREDDAERAAQAGLELVEAVRGLAPPGGPALRARISIATGLVVVGAAAGVAGEAPNRAARLQAAAEPGTVVVDAGTRRRLGGLFECRELGPIEAKGFPEPVPAWHVLRRGALSGRSEAVHTAPAPLIGREEELGLLLRGWAQAREGEGHLVLLSGEPGIGKSRLAAALTERLAGGPHARLRCFCAPQH